MNEFKNNLNENPTYACGICHKNYKSIEERMECEKKCLTERKKTEAAIAKQKLQEEKEKDRQELLKLGNEFEAKFSAYLKKYNGITTYSTKPDMDRLLDSLFERWWG